MKGKTKRFLSFFILLLCVMAISSCSSADKKTALKVIIVSKFEIEEMSGDFPGEAQLFYKEYCDGCMETEIPHMPPTGQFYVNEKNGAGILLTGSGKTAAGLSLSAVLEAGTKEKQSRNNSSEIKQSFSSCPLGFLVG